MPVLLISNHKQTKKKESDWNSFGFSSRFAPCIAPCIASIGEDIIGYDSGRLTFFFFVLFSFLFILSLAEGRLSVSPRGAASYASHQRNSRKGRRRRTSGASPHAVEEGLLGLVVVREGSNGFLPVVVEPQISSTAASPADTPPLSKQHSVEKASPPILQVPQLTFPPGPVRFVLPPVVAQEVLRGSLPLDDTRTHEMMRKVARQEYKAIAKASRLPRTWAEKLALFPSATTFFSYAKNRYPKDVLATESTRVILKEVEHDYINANYISCPPGSKPRFIACQAPIPTTMVDFWLMVWQQESCVIVMLTKFREKGLTKAHPYWPADLADPELVFGQIRVALVTQKVIPGLTVNTLRLTWSPVARNDEESELDSLKAGGWRTKSLRNLRELEEQEMKEHHSPSNSPVSLKKEGEIVRVVYHLHYTDWPDFGVPKTTRGIRNLVSYTNLYGELGASQNLRGPIISHCSAGIGRTGTFIGIHVGISLIESHIVPNVAELVSSMRACRFGMIQTDAQYVFVYEALNDHIHQHVEAKKVVRSPSHTNLSVSAKNHAPSHPLSSRPWRSRSISGLEEKEKPSSSSKKESEDSDGE